MFLALFQAVLQLVVTPPPVSDGNLYSYLISTYILLICQYSQQKTAQLLIVELQ